MIIITIEKAKKKACSDVMTVQDECYYVHDVRSMIEEQFYQNIDNALFHKIIAQCVCRQLCLK